MCDRALRQVIHRDIKPNNVLMADRSDGAALRICDFGLCALCRKEDVTRSRKASGRGSAPPSAPPSGHSSPSAARVRPPPPRPSLSSRSPRRASLLGRSSSLRARHRRAQHATPPTAPLAPRPPSPARPRAFTVQFTEEKIEKGESWGRRASNQSQGGKSVGFDESARSQALPPPHAAPRRCAAPADVGTLPQGASSGGSQRDECSEHGSVDEASERVPSFTRAESSFSRSGRAVRTTVVGTPSFMAPEVVMQAEDLEDIQAKGYSFPCDMWSVGCVA